MWFYLSEAVDLHWSSTHLRIYDKFNSIYALQAFKVNSFVLKFGLLVNNFTVVLSFSQVKVDIRLNNSAGLGSQSNRTASMDEGGALKQTRKKAEINLKTRKRYERAKTCTVFNHDDDDDDAADNANP